MSMSIPIVTNQRFHRKIDRVDRDALDEPTNVPTERSIEWIGYSVKTAKMLMMVVVVAISRVIM